MQQTISVNWLNPQKINLLKCALEACINAVSERKHSTGETTGHQPWNNQLQMPFNTCPAGLCDVKDSHGFASLLCNRCVCA